MENRHRLTNHQEHWWVVLPALLLGGLLSLITFHGPIINILCILAIGGILGMALARGVAEAPGLKFRSPAVPFFFFLILLYAARPLFVLFSGTVGTHQIGEYEFNSISRLVQSTLYTLVLAILVLSLAYSAAPSPNRALLRALTTQRTLAKRSPRIVLVLFAISGAISLLVLREMLGQPGGLVAALAVRAEFFEGRNVLIWLLQLYKLGLLVYLSLSWGAGERRSPAASAVLVLAWLATVPIDLITGSRAEFVLRNVLPIAIAMSFRHPPLRRDDRVPRQRKGVIVVAAVIGITMFVGYREVVRAGVESSGGAQSAATRTARAVIDLPNYVLSGDEAAGFDYFVVIRKEVPTVLPHRGGAGVLAFLQAPIPSNILANKERRAGDILTERLRPVLYSHGGNIGVSAAGDFHFIGGTPVVIVGFVLLGLLAGTLLRTSAAAIVLGGNQRSFAALFGFFAAASLISVMRADLFEVSVLPIRLGLLLVLRKVLTRQTGPAMEPVAPSIASSVGAWQ